MEREIPGLSVMVMGDYYAEECRGVEFSPVQETYNVCSAPFKLSAKSLEEAKALVETYRPMWEEWNDRALQAYSAHGFYNPGNGNIKVIIRAQKAAVSFSQWNDQKNKCGWILFEVSNGEWVEIGIKSGDSLNRTPPGF